MSSKCVVRDQRTMKESFLRELDINAQNKKKVLKEEIERRTRLRPGTGVKTRWLAPYRGGGGGAFGKNTFGGRICEGLTNDKLLDDEKLSPEGGTPRGRSWVGITARGKGGVWGNTKRHKTTG